LQTNSDGTPCEIKGATTSSYLLSVGDIGYFISVSYEPVRNDRARGPTAISEIAGPIVAGIILSSHLLSSFAVSEGVLISMNERGK